MRAFAMFLGAASRSRVLSLSIAAWLIFAAVVWTASGGVPYFKDGNESFLSFAHAKNLIIQDGATYSFLTIEGTSVSTNERSSADIRVYTHNPNVSRYFNFALLLLGISDIRWHVAIICGVFGAASVFLMVRTLQHSTMAAPAALVSALFLSDLFGYLQYTVNSFRVLSFFLFWACLYALVTKQRPWIAAASFFLLFSHEFAFAIFTFSSVCAVTLLLGIHGRRHQIVAALIGVAIALSLFTVQLVTYYGFDGLIADATYTRTIRNAPEGYDAAANRPDVLAEYGVMTASLTTAPTIRSLLEDVTVYLPQAYGLALCVIALVGILCAPVIMIRSAGGRQVPAASRGLAVLVLSTSIGTAVVGVLIPGYFAAGYIRSFLPLLVLPIVLSISLTVVCVISGLRFGLRAILARIPDGHTTVAAYTAAVPLVLMIGNSLNVADHYPLLDAAVLDVMRSELREVPVAASTNFHQYAFAFNRVATFAVPTIPNDEEIAALPPGTHLLCIERPWMNTRCEEVALALNARGLPVLAQTPQHVIVVLS